MNQRTKFVINTVITQANGVEHDGIHFNISELREQTTFNQRVSCISCDVNGGTEVLVTSIRCSKGQTFNNEIICRYNVIFR